MKGILLTLLTIWSVASARAAIADYTVTLDGPTEGQPSLGTGFGTVEYDDVAHTLTLQVSFSGLTGTTTASHLHAPTVSPFSGSASIATTLPSFAGFPLGVTSGTFSNILDLTTNTSWNDGFITASGGTPADAEAALAADMASGRTYWNIHSSVFTSGEIRGFLVPVPELSTLVFLGLGSGALVWRLRRRV